MCRLRPDDHSGLSLMFSRNQRWLVAGAEPKPPPVAPGDPPSARSPAYLSLGLVPFLVLYYQKKIHLLALLFEV
jgi:hypothetical protein